MQDGALAERLGPAKHRWREHSRRLGATSVGALRACVRRMTITCTSKRKKPVPPDEDAHGGACQIECCTKRPLPCSGLLLRSLLAVLLRLLAPKRLRIPGEILRYVRSIHVVYVRAVRPDAAMHTPHDGCGTGPHTQPRAHTVTPPLPSPASQTMALP